VAKKIIVLATFFVLLTGFQLKTDTIRIHFPQPWQCAFEKNMWVCEEKINQVQKPAIILVQSQLARAKETHAYFSEQLKQPRQSSGKRGPVLSTVVSFGDRVINGQKWFEAIHAEGELEAYYTHYLAARRGNYSYLVTMSSHKPKWNIYKPIFDQVAASIQPLVSPIAAQAPAASTSEPKAIPVAGSGNGLLSLGNSDSGSTPLKIGLFILIIIGGAYFLYTLRR
jgi:hypothetical protein